MQSQGGRFLRGSHALNPEFLGPADGAAQAPGLGVQLWPIEPLLGEGCITPLLAAITRLDPRGADAHWYDSHEPLFFRGA